MAGELKGPQNPENTPHNITGIILLGGLTCHEKEVEMVESLAKVCECRCLEVNFGRITIIVMWSGKGREANVTCNIFFYRVEDEY